MGQDFNLPPRKIDHKNVLLTISFVHLFAPKICNHGPYWESKQGFAFGGKGIPSSSQLQQHWRDLAMKIPKGFFSCNVISCVSES